MSIGFIYQEGQWASDSPISGVPLSCYLSVGRGVRPFVSYHDFCPYFHEGLSAEFTSAVQAAFDFRAIAPKAGLPARKAKSYLFNNYLF